MPQTAHLLFGVARELVATVRCGKVRECRLGASRQWGYALFDGGHMPNQIHDVMRVILDWFDKFLGPVKTAASIGTN